MGMVATRRETLKDAAAEVTVDNKFKETQSGGIPRALRSHSNILTDIG